MPNPLIDELLDLTTTALERRRRLPEATYRVQFHAGFKFRDAAALVPYLHALGVSDLYASPYLKARLGSLHGYDISEHKALNPEIGTEAEHAALADALRAHGMGQLVDTVPNHMGIVGNENAWWNDVLENGPSSPFAGYFDIDWRFYKPALHDRVLLPLLGDSYGQVLESQQLQLRYEQGTLSVHYYEHRFPVAPKSYALVLGHRLDELEQTLGPTSVHLLEYQSILTAIRNLPPRTETNPARIAERYREKEVVKRRLVALADASPEVRGFIERNVRIFNGTPGDSHSFDLLDQLLDEQAYRLAHWRVATDEINYRRFFDVNELAALSMEKPEVFLATHALLFRYLCEGKLTGLRIDHPDGLYDPRGYLERLQEHFVVQTARGLYEAAPREQPWEQVEGPLLEAVRGRRQDPDSPLRKPLYVVVEKILGVNEPLREDWPVYGTSGYEYLNVLNGLFVDAGNQAALNRIYNRWTDMDPLAAPLVYDKKFLIMQVSLAGELHVLAHQLDRLSEKNRWSRDYTLNTLRHALREVIACFPVYRSYIAGDDIDPRDRAYVETAVALARRKNPAISSSIFEFVRKMVLLQYPDGASDADREEQRRFAGKFQQVTAPVMAKGLEDTTFYVHTRLVSLNEVGGDPDRFGVSPDEFHRYNLERQARWPWSLAATSTHDTKRSEDVRARINVLSEIPRDWQRRLARWNRLNQRHRVLLDEMQVPDPNDEYLLYQTLVGAWPLGDYPAEEYGKFVERIGGYMQKAVHEAKVHTSWINPNPAYDEGIARFVSRVLDAKRNRAFVEDVRAFAARVAQWGMFNALAQTLLKITSPGVPDVYQGQELWDFSLVDPDNRRPVDYERRQRLLAGLRERLASPEPRLAELAAELVREREDGRVKLYVTHQALHCRRDHPGLFTVGEYHPAGARGAREDHVVAFARRLGSRCAVAVAPRLVTRLAEPPDGAPVGEAWQDTLLLLPGAIPSRRFYNVFTGETRTATEQEGHAVLPLADVLAHFPVALLMAQD